MGSVRTGLRGTDFGETPGFAACMWVPIIPESLLCIVGRQQECMVREIPQDMNSADAVKSILNIFEGDLIDYLIQLGSTPLQTCKHNYIILCKEKLVAFTSEKSWGTLYNYK